MQKVLYVVLAVLMCSARMSIAGSVDLANKADKAVTVSGNGYQSRLDPGASTGGDSSNLSVKLPDGRIESLNHNDADAYNPRTKRYSYQISGNKKNGYVVEPYESDD